MAIGRLRCPGSHRVRPRPQKENEILGIQGDRQAISRLHPHLHPLATKFRTIQGPHRLRRLELFKLFGGSKTYTPPPPPPPLLSGEIFVISKYGTHVCFFQMVYARSNQGARDTARGMMSRSDPPPPSVSMRPNLFRRQTPVHLCVSDVPD